MNSKVLGLAAVLAGILVWAASAELSWPVRLLVATLLGPAPVLFVLQARAAIALPRPLPRLRVYAGSMIALWLLAVLSVVAARASGFSFQDMGFAAVAPITLILAAVAALIGSSAVVLLFRLLGTAETDVMKDIIPVTQTEKLVFVLLSVSAGICEELTFRGVLLPALGLATGSIAAGVVLSSLAFGVLHAHQSLAGVLRAATLGAVLAVPVLVTGSIYASMTAHALIDVIGGLWLARWLFR